MKRYVPYVKRANELEAEDPLAAFYCRLYVVEQLVALKDPSVQGLAVEQLDKAEALRTTVLPADVNVSGPSQFGQFCDSVYAAAEEADETSVPTEQAMRYYFASLFYDVLTQFGPLDERREAQRARARRLVVELKRGSATNFSEERAAIAAALADLDRTDKAAALARLKDAVLGLESK